MYPIGYGAKVSKHADPTYEEAIAAYLGMALEEGEYDYFLEALSNIARGHGIAAVAESSGLGRESLYKALAPGAKPRFETVCRVMSGVGLRLSVTPKSGGAK
jgi:probable addiction module antidote protein